LECCADHPTSFSLTANAKRKAATSSGSEDEAEESFAAKISRLMGSQGTAPTAPVAKPAVQKPPASTYAFEISSDEEDAKPVKVVAKAGKPSAPPKKTAAAAAPKPAAKPAAKPKAAPKKKASSDDDEEASDVSSGGVGVAASKPGRARKPVATYKVDEDEDEDEEMEVDSEEEASEASFGGSDSDD
jgi:hypothetical protein